MELIEIIKLTITLFTTFALSLLTLSYIFYRIRNRRSVFSDPELIPIKNEFTKINRQHDDFEKPLPEEYFYREKPVSKKSKTNNRFVVVNHKASPSIKNEKQTVYSKKMLSGVNKKIQVISIKN